MSTRRDADRDGRPPRTLVVGLGNELLCDDGAGLHVARLLRTLLAGHPGVSVVEENCGGLRLMEKMVGFDRAIVIDAMTGMGEPGTVLRLGCDAPSAHCASAHDVDLPTALSVGRRVGARLPADEDVVLIGIEASKIDCFGTDCTPPVRAAIGEAARAVMAELEPARSPSR